MRKNNVIKLFFILFCFNNFSMSPCIVLQYFDAFLSANDDISVPYFSHLLFKADKYHPRPHPISIILPGLFFFSKNL